MRSLYISEKARYKKQVISVEELRKNIISQKDKCEKTLHSLTTSRTSDKNDYNVLKIVGWYKAKLIETLTNTTNYSSKESIISYIPTIRKLIIQTRAGYRFFKWIRFIGYYNDAVKNEMYTEEEKEKLRQVIEILSSMIDKQNWNRNTETLIKTKFNF